MSYRNTITSGAKKIFFHLNEKHGFSHISLFCGQMFSLICFYNVGMQREYWHVLIETLTFEIPSLFDSPC